MAAPPPRHYEMMPSVPPLYHDPYGLPYLRYHPQPIDGDGGIHTLFVSGLPEDVKPREIHNLFRRRHGFDFCQLKYTGRGDQVVAFATFIDHPSAVAAMGDLDGSIFDPESGAKLHVELARSNSRTKRPHGDGPYVIVDKRVKTDKNIQGASGNDGDGGSDSDSDGSKGYLHATPSKAAEKKDTQATKNVDQEKHTYEEVQPCSTLFIGNLGSNCTEEELTAIVSQYSGFQTLKMRGRKGSPVAFADFKDPECSTEAMKNLQGMKLASTDSDGLHVEYARSKMRNTRKEEPN